MSDEDKNKSGAAGRGLSEMFGLHPSAAAFMVLIDMMLSAGSFASMGVFVPLELLGGVVVGILTYRIQKAWGGDDVESAKIKGWMTGVITAIPVASLPFIIAYAVGGTVLGFRSKKKRDGVTIEGTVVPVRE